MLDYPGFQTGVRQYRLGSLTYTGLTSYSGEFKYTKTFLVDPSFLGEHVQVELDLGQVVVAGKIWLNGKRVGERMRRPFRFNVTNYLRLGENHLEVTVTNSDTNRRAEMNVARFQEERDLPGGRAAVYMGNLGLNGLLGPVRLVPYRLVEMNVSGRPKPRGN